MAIALDSVKVPLETAMALESVIVPLEIWTALARVTLLDSVTVPEIAMALDGVIVTLDSVVVIALDGVIVITLEGVIVFTAVDRVTKFVVAVAEEIETVGTLESVTVPLEI